MQEVPPGDSIMTDFIPFEDYLYSKMAVSTVKDTIRKMRFFDKRVDLSSRDSILEFLRNERRNGSLAKTINEHIKYLNRWLDYLGQEKIKYLKEKRSFIVKYYDAEQVKTILEKSSGPAVEDKRNHAMVLLALNTGLRRAEIAGLKVEDIHEYTVSVFHGKGEKDRTVFLDPDTREVLMEYIRIRNNQNSPFVFTTKTSAITPEYMGKIAMTITRRSKIQFSWHKCRHTYAHNLVKEDVDLETIRQMLGHEDLGTTQIYAALDSGEAIERMMRKKPHFVKDAHGYKSPAPCPRSNGLKGI